MNVFLPPESAVDEHAVLIDFASVGVGYGLTDVAMHLTHAVLSEDLADGGEERLIDAYLAALAEARGPKAAPYPKKLAMRHYMAGGGGLWPVCSRAVLGESNARELCSQGM